MRTGLLVVCAALAIAAPVQASTWKLVSSNAEEIVFLGERVAAGADAVQRRTVLKSFESEQSLGGWYAHRSQTLDVLIDCEQGRYALMRWVFHDGSLGYGRTVWADVMEGAAFDRPAAHSAEQRVLEAACARP
jgi:hypothetical protein